jgi:hypothetical protein
MTKIKEKDSRSGVQDPDEIKGHLLQDNHQENGLTSSSCPQIFQ